MAEPRILEHVEQSTATTISFEGNYISFYNTDETNSASFNLTSKKTGTDVFTSDITVGAGETWSNFVPRYTAVTITNANSVALIVDLGT